MPLLGKVTGAFVDMVRIAKCIRYYWSCI